MGRGSTQLLVRKITECLASGPKTISEIASATGRDRAAISRYLSILTLSKLLIEEPEGSSKRFTLVPAYRTDTFFGLPLDLQAEKDISSVYNSIRKNWQAVTSNKLLNTHAQKIAYKVISSCAELHVPIGWYLYGGISVVAYDNSKDYGYFGLPVRVEDCIRDTTIDYAKNYHAWEAKKYQYQDMNSELYLTKEDILSILYSNNFDTAPRNSLYVLIKKIRKLVSLAPKSSRSQYTEILDAYQDLMMDATTKLGDEDLIHHKKEVTLLFEAVWKYIALFNFKQDLLKYYSLMILDLHFRLDIQQQEDEILELGTSLQAIIPEETARTPIEEKLAEALSKMKTSSPEELAKSKAEFEANKKKLSSEQFQEWLLERAGLK